jgi:hypothetical protein
MGVNESTDGEYPALRPSGFYDIGIDDLERIFVGPFGAAGSHRRRMCERFKAWFSAMEELGVPFEVWIDGSFVTAKPKPADIDIVWLFDGESIQRLKPETVDRLDELMDSAMLKYSCHVFPAPKEDADVCIRWKEMFEGYRNKKQSKGLFRIVSGEKQ